MPHNTLPEGWKIIFRNDFLDYHMDRYEYQLLLLRWRPAYKTFFLRRVRQGEWKTFRILFSDRWTPTNEDRAAARAEALEIVALTLKDEARIGKRIS